PAARTDGPRSFSPSSPLFRMAAQTVEARTRDEALAGDAAGAISPWRTQIIHERASVDSKPAAAPAASDYMARYELARKLQGELKRVGCYYGDVDGDWGMGSKRAMAGFLERVNATLPTDSPDYILLTLVQGHADRACGVSCPSGQALANDGRCLPTAIIARAKERTAPAVATASSTDTSAAANLVVADVPPPALSPRHSTESRSRQVIAMPDPVAPSSFRKADSDTWRKRTTVAVARELTKPLNVPEPRRVARDIPAAVTVAERQPPVAATDSAPREPLPGRMAIGAPAMPAASIPAVAATPVVTPPVEPEQQARQRAIAALPAGVVEEAPSAPRVHEPSRSRERSARRSDRPSPVARPEPSRRGYAEGSVRTYQGRVRRGSPQHNLMLSLGGVF
ncbi:MAG: hypothetical protein AB7L18_13405, partial [Hyphomicrobiaceae bacterium]